MRTGVPFPFLVPAAVDLALDLILYSTAPNCKAGFDLLAPPVVMCLHFGNERGKDIILKQANLPVCAANIRISDKFAGYMNVLNEMKVLAIADIDDFHWKHGSGQADVVVSCGDISDQVILEAAEANACQVILAVKGNHDSNAPFASPIADLHWQTKEHGGLRFGGLNGSWKYKPRGHFLYDQWEVDEFLVAFPPVDIFVSHNSPRGIHDKEDGVHCGFDGLNAYIGKMQPCLVIHGHQHVNDETTVGKTRVVGVYGHKMIEV